MRLYTSVVCAAVIAGTLPAIADHEPVLVVPGRPDVPVIVNGLDMSWGYADGDWGLYRPGAPQLYLTPSPIVVPLQRGTGYFPSEGHPARSGRLEIQPPPNRALPPPAPSFHRSWGAASDPAPATIPQDPPPVIIAPTFGYGRRPHP